jgi:glycosyltransferase involved in cell wall biosynthesis
MDKAKAGDAANAALIPCGVDTDLFRPMDSIEARKELGLDQTAKYVLFAGAFDNRVKNPELAKAAVTKTEGVRLLELKGYSRLQVALLMNAVDACLMTSFTEGSPQFIKEALACNCPVVSVDVGDVKAVIEGVEGCYIAKRDAEQIAIYLEKALSIPKNNDGYERIRELRLNANEVTNKLLSVYQKIIDHA